MSDMGQKLREAADSIGVGHPVAPVVNLLNEAAQVIDTTEVKLAQCDQQVVARLLKDKEDLLRLAGNKNVVIAANERQIASLRNEVKSVESVRDFLWDKLEQALRAME